MSVGHFVYVSLIDDNLTGNSWYTDLGLRIEGEQCNSQVSHHS